MFATFADMLARYGEKRLQELGATKIIDPLTGMEISDYSNYQANVEMYLQDAYSIVVQKISNCFCFSEFKEAMDAGEIFPMLRMKQMNIAIDMMEQKGDCKDCGCVHTDDLCDYASICSLNAVCIEKCIRLSVAERVSCLPKSCEPEQVCGVCCE